MSIIEAVKGREENNQGREAEDDFPFKVASEVNFVLHEHGTRERDSNVKHRLGTCPGIIDAWVARGSLRADNYQAACWCLNQVSTN